MLLRDDRNRCGAYRLLATTIIHKFANRKEFVESSPVHDLNKDTNDEAFSVNAERIIILLPLIAATCFR